MRYLRDVLQFLIGLFVHRPVNLRRRSLSGRAQEFAVFGLGRFGSSMAMTLVERGHAVLAIDHDETLVQRFADEITQTANLDVTDEDALRDIDIASYDTVVIAIGTNFEANIMATVACKQLGVKRVVCKAMTFAQRDILLKVGADRVVLPEHESGFRLAMELSTPGIGDVIRLGCEALITEVAIPRRFQGRPIGDIVAQHPGISIVAATDNSGYVVAPAPSFLPGDGTTLVVVGLEAEIAAFLSS